MTLELFEQGPAVYIPYLLLSLMITLAVYCAFPLLFIKLREKPITKKKYRFLCYGINLVLSVFLNVIAGDITISLWPYILWTGVFSRLGIKMLTASGLLLDVQHETHHVDVQSPEMNGKKTEKIIDAESISEGIAGASDTDNTVLPPPISFSDISEDISQDDALKAFVAHQAKETIRIMTLNKDIASVDETDPEFGLVPQKPIYTFAINSVRGEHEYLQSLRTIAGEEITWTRRGSLDVDGVNGMVDIYDTFLPSGILYKTIYINMYGAKTSRNAPTGFTIIPKGSVFATGKSYAEVEHKTANEKSEAKEFCKRCSVQIDNHSRQCTGCGKQYFKFTPKLALCLVSIPLVVAAIGIIIFSVLKKENHQHNYHGYITAATCTTRGYTTYVCDCGDSYIGNYTTGGHSLVDYKCKSCDFVDREGMYRHLKYWILEHGEKEGSVYSYYYAVGEGEDAVWYSISFSSDDGMLFLYRGNMLNGISGVTILTLDDGSYGTYFGDYSISGQISKECFSSSYTVPYSSYNCPENQKEIMVELARTSICDLLEFCDLFLWKYDMGITLADLGFTSY